MKNRRLLLGVLLGLASWANAQLPGQQDSLAETIEDKLTELGIPGAVVGMIDNGKTVYLRAHGISDVKTRAPMKVDALFDLGTLSRQFQMVSIWKLIERGQLSLDTQLSQYLPDYPVVAPGPQLRDLLRQTSGLPDPLDDAEFDLSKPASADEVLAAMKKGKPTLSGKLVAFSFGDGFTLGQLLKKRTGQNWWELAQEQFWKPLGMSATRVDGQPGVPGHMDEGEGKLGKPEALAPTTQMLLGSGVRSTVADLLKFEAALLGERLIPRGLLNLARAPQMVNGKASDFSLGFEAGKLEYDDNETFASAGFVAGYSHTILRVPEHKLSVVVLTNMDGKDVYGLASDLANQWLALNEKSDP